MENDPNLRQRIIAEFRWRMAEAERQVDQGFPLARTVNNLWSSAFLEVMESYDRGEKLRYLSAVAKDCQPWILEAAGATITKDEEDFRQEVDRRIHDIEHPRWIKGQSRASAEPNPIKKGKLGSALVAGLKPLLGPVKDRTSDGTWWFVTPVDGWYLGTLIMVGRRIPYSVDIKQQLVQYEWAWLFEPSTFLRLVRARWDVASDAELPKVLESLLGVSRFALEAAPSITSQVVLDAPQ